MTYTFFININSVVTQVYPLNWLECSLVDEKESDQIFYRRKFEGSLTFGGKKLCADFTLFNDCRLSDPYAGIDLLILQDLDIYWEGYFSPANGTFDFTAKTFTVTPKVTDDYTAFDNYGEQEYNIMDVATLVDVTCNGVLYERNRWLTDVIEFLAGKVFTGSVVTSEFFSNTTNYVTLQASKVNYLTIAQKSDIKRPGSSNPAVVGELSFKGIMSILHAMFNLYWTYDLSSNILTIEHLSRFSASEGLDLRSQGIAKSLLTMRYENESMPAHEKWSFMEALSPDFKGGSIEYRSPAVDEFKTDEIFIPITTEIGYIQDIETVDSISDSGFVILINYESGGSYYTYSGPGLSDSTVRYNIHLAWSYLLQNYHRHGRVLPTGYRNGILQIFLSSKKTILHDINAIVCPVHDYIPEDYIITELGEDYLSGLKGYVKKASLKPYGEVNFTLMYGPEDLPNEGYAPNVKSLNVVVVGLDVRAELSEINIYDTHFSIWTNENTCDTFTIPAGDLLLIDLLSQIDPIVTVDYNFTHASLTGWIVTVNGSTTFDTATEGECSTGAPAPPAVPDVPVITGHGQFTTCGPIRIIWTAEADATYYVLQRIPSLGGLPIWETQYSGASLFYDDPDAGVQEGVTFTYRVASGNISGLSAFSGEHEVNDIMC